MFRGRYRPHLCSVCSSSLKHGVLHRSVELQVVVTVAELSLQTHRLILNEPDGHSVICRLQEFDSWVPWGASHWCSGTGSSGGHRSLGDTSAGCPHTPSDFSLPHLLLPACQEAGDPLTDGGRTQLAGQHLLDLSLIRNQVVDCTASSSDLFACFVLQLDPHQLLWGLNDFVHPTKESRGG